jgi:hypothetical protein
MPDPGKHWGVDALPHAPLGLGGSVSPTPLSSSFHLSSFAMRWSVPVPMPRALATLKIPTPFASCFLAFGRAVYLRPAELHALGDSALEAWCRSKNGHRPEAAALITCFDRAVSRIKRGRPIGSLAATIRAEAHF